MYFFTLQYCVHKFSALKLSFRKFFCYFSTDLNSTCIFLYLYRDYLKMKQVLDHISIFKTNTHETAEKIEKTYFINVSKNLSMHVQYVPRMLIFHCAAEIDQPRFTA
jgi:hypothetical protein